jgi:Reverse transcriptase (RNA-dependent DNA polymerase)
MDLPRDFLSHQNFDLAFTRIVRAGNKEYKTFYRHLFPSFNLALPGSLKDVIEELKRGTFDPEKPTVVYQPKKSGILRPLTLLSLRDLIVYQAIVNLVAVSFGDEQASYAFKKTFGAIFAGRTNPFFYRSWKTSYRRYNEAMTAAYAAGNDFIADFDLVSFYELIDHDLLAERLRRRVKNEPLIELLLTCLRKWISDKAGANVGHGVPQGPEASAFLAECFLFHFDIKDYRPVRYFRYIDDIRLMAKDEQPAGPC